MSSKNLLISEPEMSCRLCPRLAGFLDEQRAAHPDWFNGPVRSFGPENARLLIVGLAPGMRGANRTGRAFTGDGAGELLYKTLDRFGFSKGRFEAHRDDGLELVDCMVTNAVRCLPPQNKVTSAEIATCNRYLRQRIKQLPDLKVILALGRVAHDATLNALNAKRSIHRFAHAAEHDFDDLTLLDSYHCSRYNTNTGRLTEEMFDSVFRRIREWIS